MKTITLILAGMIMLSFMSCGKQEATKNNLPTEKVAQPKTQKEIWWEKLNQPTKKLISMLDSFNPAPGATPEGISLQREGEKPWQEIMPTSISWKVRDWNENGEMITVKTIRSHVGHAYVVKVKKNELWERYAEKTETQSIPFTLIYGILIEADTVNGKIFPAGTYLATHFLENWRLNKNEYEVKYFTSYQKFSNFIFSEIYEVPCGICGYNEYLELQGYYHKQNTIQL